MQVGEFFTLAELTKTDQAALNQPGEVELVNLARLCALVLDPLRLLMGPLNVNSGFRNAKVNAAVGGVPTSYHMRGLAADIWSPKHSPKALCDALGGLAFDQAIVYPDREFMHVQVAPIGGTARGERLEYRNGSYRAL